MKKTLSILGGVALMAVAVVPALAIHRCHHCGYRPVRSVNRATSSQKVDAYAGTGMNEMNGPATWVKRSSCVRATATRHGAQAMRTGRADNYVEAKVVQNKGYGHRWSRELNSAQSIQGASVEAVTGMNEMNGPRTGVRNSHGVHASATTYGNSSMVTGDATNTVVLGTVQNTNYHRYRR